MSKLLIQLITSGVTSRWPSKLWLNFLLLHSVTICFIVCSPLPQSQTGNPYLCKRAPHLPWPVRSLFSVDQVLRGRFIPRTPILGSSTNFPFDTIALAHSFRHSSALSNPEPDSFLAVLTGGFLDFNRCSGVRCSIWCKSEHFWLADFQTVFMGASFLRICGGLIFARTGNHWNGVDFVYLMRATHRPARTFE